MKARMQSISKKISLEIDTNPAFAFCSFRFIAFSEATEKESILLAVHIPKDRLLVNSLRTLATVIEQKMLLGSTSMSEERKEVNSNE